jgi:hypothetical protein
VELRRASQTLIGPGAESAPRVKNAAGALDGARCGRTDDLPGVFVQALSGVLGPEQPRVLLGRAGAAAKSPAALSNGLNGNGFVADPREFLQQALPIVARAKKNPSSAGRTPGGCEEKDQHWCYGRNTRQPRCVASDVGLHCHGGPTSGPGSHGGLWSLENVWVKLDGEYNR